MQKPQQQTFKAKVSYEGKSENFTFWIIGISPDIKGDVKKEYKKLRASRGQRWNERKYKFIECSPTES